jgi:hypothetical protein
MKYYFISYTWRQIGNDVQHFANELIDKEPLEWLLGAKEYDSQEYALLSFSEISKDQYDKFRDHLN